MEHDTKKNETNNLDNNQAITMLKDSYYLLSLQIKQLSKTCRPGADWKIYLDVGSIIIISLTAQLSLYFLTLSKKKSANLK